MKRIALLQWAVGKENQAIADKGYDSEESRELIREKGSAPYIPRKKLKNRD